MGLAQQPGCGQMRWDGRGTSEAGRDSCDSTSYSCRPGGHDHRYSHVEGTSRPLLAPAPRERTQPSSRRSRSVASLAADCIKNELLSPIRCQRAVSYLD